MDDDFNTDVFIDEVEKRPAIWDLHSKEYSNKILKKRAWEQLVSIFCHGDDTEEKKKNLGSRLQNKWKNLRDVYVRDVKKIKTLKSGSATISKSTSTYFQRLTFLQPTVQKRKSESSFEVEDDTENDISETVDENTDSNFRPPGECPPAEKKYKLHPADEHFAKLLEKSINQRKPKETQEDDEDKLFCLSLFKELKKVHEHNRLRQKIQIYDLMARNQVQANTSQLNQPSSSFSQHYANSQERQQLSRNRLDTQQNSVRHYEYQHNLPHSPYGFMTYSQTDTTKNTNLQYTRSPLSSAKTPERDLFSDENSM